MGATSAQVEWLFTSYIAIMAVTMLISGVLSTRLGGRKVMLLGLSLVVVFAALSGLAQNIPSLAVFRAGWGLGNAFFTSTALSVIVGASSGGMAAAITLYEAALGLGIASGAAAGRVPWQYLVAAAVLRCVDPDVHRALVHILPRERTEAERAAAQGERPVSRHETSRGGDQRSRWSVLQFRVLHYHGVLAADAEALEQRGVGYTYFAWGILVGISSVFVVNWLRPLLGPIRLLEYNMLALVLVFVAAALVPGNGLLWVIIISGFFCGISNALFTTLAMEVSPFSGLSRPAPTTSYAGPARPSRPFCQDGSRTRLTRRFLSGWRPDACLWGALRSLSPAASSRTGWR